MYSSDDNWELHPIGGATGDAYMGVRYDEKVFLKRNTSPFIAALSAEGIVPKLMWTQRTFSGDTLTAQEWKEGYTLSREDMDSEAVIELIQRIHQSDHLLIMLKRVGEGTMRPLDFINNYFDNLSPSLTSNQYLNSVIRKLEDAIDDDFYNVNTTLCHGDLNHNNFLQGYDDTLYLVDWENVRIADPISDITMLLIQYFQPSEWMGWFQEYDFPITESFYKRVKWYSMINCMYLIKQYFAEARQQKANEFILLLKSINS